MSPILSSSVVNCFWVSSIKHWCGGSLNASLVYSWSHLLQPIFTCWQTYFKCWWYSDIVSKSFLHSKQALLFGQSNFMCLLRSKCWFLTSLHFKGLDLKTQFNNCVFLLTLWSYFAFFHSFPESWFTRNLGIFCVWISITHTKFLHNCHILPAAVEFYGNRYTEKGL